MSEGFNNQSETKRRVGDGTPGPGRPKGVPNKSSAIMKAAIESVYTRLQEKTGEPHGHFLAWAEETPTEFYKLAAKLIPLQLAGDPDAPVVVNVTRTILDPKTAE